MTERKSCEIKKNAFGLYDIQVKDESGRITTDIRGVTLARAIRVLENSMGRAGDE